MKIDSASILKSLATIRRDHPACSDEEMACHLAASLGETHPPPNSGPRRFTFRTSELRELGGKYQLGKIHMSDHGTTSPFHPDEGGYCVPSEHAPWFESMVNSLNTDLPIWVQIGSLDLCVRESKAGAGESQPSTSSTQTQPE